jgi:hypothetical protein
LPLDGRTQPADISRACVWLRACIGYLTLDIHGTIYTGDTCEYVYSFTWFTEQVHGHRTTLNAHFCQKRKFRLGEIGTKKRPFVDIAFVRHFSLLVGWAFIDGGLHSRLITRRYNKYMTITPVAQSCDCLGRLFPF